MATDLRCCVRTGLSPRDKFEVCVEQKAALGLHWVGVDEGLTSSLQQNVKLMLQNLLVQQEKSMLAIADLLRNLEKVDVEVEAEVEEAKGATAPEEITEAREERKLRPVMEVEVASIEEETVPVESVATKCKKNRVRTLMSSPTNNNLSGVLESGKMTSSVWKICNSLAKSKRFDYLMGFIVFVNGICVGIETQWSLEDEMEGQWPAEVDLLFVMVYIFELTVNLVARGVLQCFKDPWFIFDAFLVMCGIVSSILLPLINLMLGNLQLGFLDAVLVIRTLRLLRLVRALRMLKHFRIVWRLVYGLLTSWNTMTSTFALLLLTLYMFACLGVELIAKDTYLQSHAETEWIVQECFGSLPRALLTLMQFVTVDSVAGIYVPLIVHRPILIVYFVLLILFVSIALMNMVTAVLVEGALDQGRADRELEKHDLQEKLKFAMPQLKAVFTDLDKNGDGTVTLEEIDDVPMDVLPRGLFDDSNFNGLHELFELLDVEGTGELGQDEFVEGILDIFSMGMPIETVQILKLLRMTGSNVCESQIDLRGMKANLDIIMRQLSKISHLMVTDLGSPREDLLEQRLI
eukprot:TRINITY_DN5580_c0_g1_i5.p1 TRINITY_DN5580_c0_g1~~TRINITY_DN5580_c0_g1_i5.p1  ORF type:complete len:576 (+),score=124.79 TRINITY_DN5580_c0_g1_i5:59-1786(+)